VAQSICNEDDPYEKFNSILSVAILASLVVLCIVLMVHIHKRYVLKKMLAEQANQLSNIASLRSQNESKDNDKFKLDEVIYEDVDQEELKKQVLIASQSNPIYDKLVF
jgi:hypothetical protein